MQTPAPANPTPTVRGQVILLHRPKAAPDGELALNLERELKKRGCQVALESRETAGFAWARVLTELLPRADLVVPLVSATSAASELLGYELELAVQAAQTRNGLPQLLPLRVFYKGPLAEPTGSIIRPVEFVWDAEAERHVSHMVFWNSHADDASVADRIAAKLDAIAATRSAPAPSPAPPRVVLPALESVGGAVPLDSRFYVERPTDDEFLEAVRRKDSLILLKGARQMGKTSLLARGLREARDGGCEVVLTDLQKLQADHFQSLPVFLHAVAELVADRFAFAVEDQPRWSRNPNMAFERFWTHEVLGRIGRPVLWAIDEFDRLFTTPFGGEVCSLLRSWHNARALDPSQPWGNLTTAIAYATEAHLFITDLNQSPFNVGTRLALDDFSLSEVERLNELYQHPLRTPAEKQQALEWLGGHPHLLRCALNTLTEQGKDIAWLRTEGELDHGPFADHLRRLLYAVGSDPQVLDGVRALIRDRTPLDTTMFYRLRSAGVLRGASSDTATFRCGLYADYLRRHLL